MAERSEPQIKVTIVLYYEPMELIGLQIAAAITVYALDQQGTALEVMPIELLEPGVNAHFEENPGVLG